MSLRAVLQQYHGTGFIVMMFANCRFKYHSDEDIPAALQHEHGQTASGRVTGEGVDIAPRVDANLIMTHLENNRKLQESLLDGMEIYRVRTYCHLMANADIAYSKIDFCA